MNEYNYVPNPYGPYHNGNPYGQFQQQNYYSNPYQYQGYYSNPYQQQYGYGNPYQYQGYYSNPHQQQYGYNNYYQQQNYFNPYQQNRYCTSTQYQEQIEKEKAEKQTLIFMKIKIAYKSLGEEFDELEIKKTIKSIYDPEQPSYEEQIKMREEISHQRINSLYENAISGKMVMPNMQEAYAFRKVLNEYNQRINNMDSSEFLLVELPKFKVELWERNNLVPLKQERNMQSLYNSREYNELLAMHARSNNTPFSNLASLYDNNVDDFVIGVQNNPLLARQALEQSVPKHISSEEEQRRRALFTNALLQQVARKNSSVVV